MEQQTLHLALKVIDLNQNDRVYVSDLTFVATLQPILYERAIPVLIDSGTFWLEHVYQCT